MTTARSLAYANTLILSGTLVAAVVVGAPLALADERGHWLPYSVGLVFAAPAVTLVGTAWSGWISLREPRSRGFWSRALFTLGIVLCLLELLWILRVVLGVGSA
jgi:hypothetical protein